MEQRLHLLHLQVERFCIRRCCYR